MLRYIRRYLCLAIIFGIAHAYPTSTGGSWRNTVASAMSTTSGPRDPRGRPRPAAAHGLGMSDSDSDLSALSEAPYPTSGVSLVLATRNIKRGGTRVFLRSKRKSTCCLTMITYPSNPPYCTTATIKCQIMSSKCLKMLVDVSINSCSWASMSCTYSLNTRVSN